MTVADDEPDAPIRSVHFGGGLTWGFRFDSQGIAQELTGANLVEALDTDAGWVWLNLDLADERVVATVRGLAGLPPAVERVLLDPDDKPKVDLYGAVIAGIMNDYEKRPQLDARYGLSWRFALLPKLLVTARAGHTHALAQVHADIQNGRCFTESPHLLAALVNEFGIASRTLLIDVGTLLNEAEEQLLDKPDVANSKVPGLARRSLLYIHRQAMPVFGILNNLLLQRPDWFSPQALAEFRRIADRMESLHEDITLSRERAHTLQDDFKAQESERTNSRLTVLTVVSALLLPPTFITGLFGMNVGGLPLVNDPVGFGVAAFLMVVSIVVMLVILRRIRMI